MAAAEGAEYLIGLHGDVMVDVAVSQDGVFSGDVRKAVSTSVRLSDFLHETTDLHVARQENETPAHSSTTLRLYLAQCQILSEGAGDVPSLPKLSKLRREAQRVTRLSLCWVNVNDLTKDFI